jgi:uncharacterized protein YeaO (DUF488 family)
VIKIRRVYAEPGDDEGFRVLIDRLWPRGLNKQKVKLDLWLKDIAPSDALRKWFVHDPKKWAEFRHRYFQELSKKEDLIGPIVDKAQKGVVTFLYGTKEERFNNAVVLKDYLEAKMKKLT